jgi:tetratricopeptide (TPR) repeat protein
VRITAQLIEANSGTHLWTENYDREFTDIFAIQEDIAEAIAKALRVPLGSKPGNILVNNRNIDAESYQQYLRAKTLMRTRGQARIISAAALLEQVVARNPEYAPAWALLGLAYHLQPNSSPERTTGSLDEFRTVVNRLQPKAEAAGRRAVELDPNLADGHIVLADVQGVRGNLLQSLETVQSKVLVLDPNNPEALHGYALGLSLVGHAKEALPVRQRLLELEPAGPNFVVRTALVLWLVGQNDAAIAMLRDLPPDRSGQLARIYASMGRYNEAIDVLEKLPSGTYPPETVKEAVRLLRTAPTKVASPESLPPLGSLGWVYLYVGAPDRVLEVYDRGVAARYLAGAGDPDSLWHPSYAPVRKTERFKAFARNAGMVEYWRAKGWPELCRPTGADDFVCD